MPELPEVETVRRGLEACLPGQRVTQIDIREERSFQGDASAVLHVPIQALSRRGKLLHIHFENEWVWLVHLRMTGQMIYVSNEGTSQAGGGHPSDSLKHGQPGKHTRVCIELDSGGSILFNDQRKFGYIKSIPSSKLDEDTFLKTLGPEPWDEAFSSTYLRDVCQRRKQTAIKQVILDQKVVAGFGNIYVDEALFLAGIRPTRKAGRIAKKSLGRLIEHGREVLERGIEFGGVSVSDYVNAEGLRGTMQRQLYVYNRANEPCKQCETPIRKITVAGRGTHYCPNCQH